MRERQTDRSAQKRRLARTACGLLAACLAAAGCAAGDGSAQVIPAPAATATRNPSEIVIPAQSNIFGAGRAVPPAPAGGGAGVLPPMLQLPPGAARTLTFESITGLVNPIVAYQGENGPGGDRAGPTNIESFEGIAGIIHRNNGMFLVGVFLGDAAPSGQAPTRLDFTAREDFVELAPEIGQTFFIGDGRSKNFRIPPAATRLFLGFADGFHFQGPPGWYGNNAGNLQVIVKVAID